MTPGQTSDVHGTDMLLNHLAAGSVLLGDKGYDADWIREKIEAQDAAPNIPDKSNRREKGNVPISVEKGEAGIAG